MRSKRSSHTPLFRLVRRALDLASRANQADSPPAKELVERTTELSRRAFLKRSAAAVLGAATAPSLLSTCAQPRRITRGVGAPRIAVVGAGIAGLHCAYRLNQAGFACSVFEASSRVSGRIVSRKDLLGPGLITEVGGSFIDSTHEDMLGLCAEFGLDLWDVESLDPAWRTYTFFFDGRHVGEAEVVEALRPLVPRMEADQKLVGDFVTFENPGRAAPLDNTTLAEYLDSLGARGWIRDLLDVAFVTEFGLDAAEQSCLNMLMQISTDVTQEDIALFGESDERYKVAGGNMRVTAELESRLDEPVRTGHRLEALRAQGNAYVLTFQGPGRSIVEVDADFVVLTVPFTLLRNIELRVEMPPYKRNAIEKLGYGTNAKVMAGFTRRIWHDQGYLGYAFSDEPFQMGWDNTLVQPGQAGGITFFSGGRAGLQVGTGTAEQQVQRLLPGMNEVYPGLARLRNGTAFQMPWPKYAYSLGSYSCYRPGQWTTIAGAEIKPVNRILFAGEHCSLDFQGFMNGGASTGRKAAERILAWVAG